MKNAQLNLAKISLWWSLMQKNPNLFVKCVGRLVTEKVIWQHIYVYILGRKSIPAISVKGPSCGKGTWLLTFVHIQMRENSFVSYVEWHSSEIIIWWFICGDIMEIRDSFVIIVKRRLPQKEIWMSIFELILEKRSLNVTSANRSFHADPSWLIIIRNTVKWSRNRTAATISALNLDNIGEGEDLNLLCPVGNNTVCSLWVTARADSPPKS